MNYLAICAIVKDEDGYLAEWVRYHKAVGVEKFYLFDNESAHPVQEELRAYVEAGFVSVVKVQGSPAQLPVYDYFVKSCKQESQWVAFIDADEYLVPVRHNDLKTLLRDYEQFGGLAVNWLLFGSSGHKTRPVGLTMDNYRRRSEKSLPENAHVKTIVQPAKATATGGNPHGFLYQPGFCCVNEKMQPVPSAFSPHSSDLIQLNHYHLRSEEEFTRKMNRPRADNGECYPPAWYYQRDAVCNAVVDETILRFRPFVV